MEKCIIIFCYSCRMYIVFAQVIKKKMCKTNKYENIFSTTLKFFIIYQSYHLVVKLFECTSTFDSIQIVFHFFYTCTHMNFAHHWLAARYFLFYLLIFFLSYTYFIYVLPQSSVTERRLFIGVWVCE